MDTSTRWVLYTMFGNNPVIVSLPANRGDALEAVRAIVGDGAYIHATDNTIRAMFDGSEPEWGDRFEVIATNVQMGVSWARSEAQFIVSLRHEMEESDAIIITPARACAGDGCQRRRGKRIMDRKYIAVLPGGTTARIVSGSFTLNISTDDADPTIEIEMLQNNGEFPPELDADYIIVVRQKDGK